MAKTINWANVSIGFDASKIKAGVDMSRQDLNRLTKVLRENADPAKSLERDVRLLNDAFKAGAIDLQTYNRNLDSLKQKSGQAAKETKAFTGLSSDLKKLGGIAAAVAGVNSFRTTMNAIDEQANIARTIGEDINELRRFAFQQQMLAGIDFGQSIDALRQMQEMVGLASIGQGKGAKILESIGLDPATLAKASPIQQFEAIREAIAAVEDQSTRAAIASKLFGDSKLVQAITASSNELKTAKEQAQQFVGVLNDADVSRIEAVNDQLDMVNMRLETAKINTLGFGSSLINDAVNGLNMTWAAMLDLEDTALFDKAKASALQQDINIANAALAAKKRRDEIEIQRSEAAKALSEKKKVGIAKETQEWLDDAQAKAELDQMDADEKRAAALKKHEMELLELKKRNLDELNQRFNPVAKAKEELEKLMVLLDSGAIDQKLFDKDKKKILRDAADAMAGPQAASNKLLEFGSTDAFKTLQEEANQIQEEMLKQQQEQLAEQKISTEAQKQAVDFLRSIAEKASRPFR